MPHYKPFVGEIHLWPVDSCHIGLLMRKGFLYHDVIKIPLSIIQWGRNSHAQNRKNCRDHVTYAKHHTHFSTTYYNAVSMRQEFENCRFGEKSTVVLKTEYQERPGDFVRCPNAMCLFHDDVIEWKHFPRYWPFVQGIHKGQWRGALVFSLICAWINGWVNNREAGNLNRHRAHYDVIVM